MVVRADGDYNVNSSYSCYMQGNQFLCNTKREEQEEISVTLLIPKWRGRGHLFVCLFVAFCIFCIPKSSIFSSVSSAYFALIKERHQLTNATLLYSSPVYMAAYFVHIKTTSVTQLPLFICVQIFIPYPLLLPIGKFAWSICIIENIGWTCAFFAFVFSGNKPLLID